MVKVKRSTRTLKRAAVRPVKATTATSEKRTSASAPSLLRKGVNDDGKSFTEISGAKESFAQAPHSTSAKAKP